MPALLDGSKFLELIADNEKKVASLYRRIGEESGIGQAFFEKMALDEDKHEVIYRGIIEQYNTELSLRTEQATADYVELLMENDLLSDMDYLLESARKTHFKSQIFDICERIERDSVMYVREFMDLYPDVAPDQMKIILAEEKKHLQMILEKKSDRAMFGIGM